jgi:protein TonB
MKNIAASSCIAALIALVVFVLPGYATEAPAADAPQDKESIFDPVAPRQPEFKGAYFSLADVDTRPISKGTPASPVFPKEFRKAGVSGEATVAFIISAEGVPGQIQVTKASHRGFADAAAKCVTKWRFKPAIKDGKPVSCVMERTIVFTSPM